jgi:hypothetical protein
MARAAIAVPAGPQRQDDRVHARRLSGATSTSMNLTWSMEVALPLGLVPYNYDLRPFNNPYFQTIYH